MSGLPYSPGPGMESRCGNSSAGQTGKGRETQGVHGRTRKSGLRSNDTDGIERRCKGAFSVVGAGNVCFVDTMKFCVLGSGSKGNATYIEHDGAGLLIDAGFSGKELSRRMALAGGDMDRLVGIVVTHEHHDHIHGAGILSRKYGIPVYLNEGTAQAGAKRLGAVESLHHFVTGGLFSVGPFHLHPFSVSHDTADPVGFVVESGERRLGYCTDTGMVSRLLLHRLGGCHGLILECNHDPQMLSDGPYPLHLQQRVRSREGHLANADAAQFLGELLHADLLHIVLAHLSDTNNTPELALETVTAYLATLNNGFPVPEISLGWQDRPGKMVSL